jgi:hypothetical protein
MNLSVSLLDPIKKYSEIARCSNIVDVQRNPEKTAEMIITYAYSR